QKIPMLSASREGTSRSYACGECRLRTRGNRKPTLLKWWIVHKELGIMDPWLLVYFIKSIKFQVFNINKYN
ncbi:MAG: hypothetical protein ABRQ25_11720, partial [Clostridiaceae bacterium]